MNSSADVIVIGGGVIGLSTAFELSKYGVKVVLLDQSEPGKGCSYGNAGWLTPCFGVPLPRPGMLLKSAKWLLDPLSPLYIQPQLNFMFAQWMLRFLRSMRAHQERKSTAALTELCSFSLREFESLESDVNHSFGFTRKGLILLAQNEKESLAAELEMKFMAEFGIQGKALGSSEIKEMEPAITGKNTGGIFFPDQAHVEPYEVCQAYLKGCIGNGVIIHNSTEVFSFETSQNRIKSIQTTRGSFSADNIVLATGSWSTSLGRQIGLRLPVLGGKGYSLILEQLPRAPKIPIMIMGKKIAITPRAQGVRLAGTLELVHQDFSITQRRVGASLKGSQECISIPENVKVEEVWRGLRPCTSDGMPIIGFSKNFSNLFINTGHQMTGLKTAPASAVLAKDLLLRKAPQFDPAPFAANRF